MKYRLISIHGDGLALAAKLQKEGHDVSFWVKTKQAKPSYDGIVDQVDDWRKGVTKETFLLFDMVGMGHIADRLKGDGFKTYGGGKLNDSLELNRAFGMKTAKMCGIKVPNWKQFTNFKTASRYVQDNECLWVFKPMNNKNPELTYVSQSNSDMLDMLEYFGSVWEGDIDFVLQEKIEGVEISTEAFYIDGVLVKGTLNSTIELKKFMDSDIGPNTGCQGSVVRFWKKSDPKIYKLTLAKLESFLKRFKYTGPLDCNCIISEKDKMPYFLEWTARLGYSAIYAVCEGIKSFGGFLDSVTVGDAPVVDYDWLGSVRVSIPPYPNDKGLTGSAGRPIGGVDESHTCLLDARYEKGKLVSAGVDGVICEVTGKAPNANALSSQVYERVERLSVPDKQYRTDVFTMADERIKQLHKWKYI